MFLKGMLFPGHAHQMARGGLTVGQDRREGKSPVIRAKKGKSGRLRREKSHEFMNIDSFHNFLFGEDH